jgi:hypothetical protein
VAARGALAVGVVAVVLTPWFLRNLREMDAPIVVSTNLGDTLCIDHRPGPTGKFAWDPYCFPDHGVSPAREEVVRNDDNIDRAIRWTLEHPGTELRQIAVRAWYTHTSDHDGLDDVEQREAFLGSRLRTVLRWTADVYFFAVLALAVPGAVLFVRGRRPGALAVVLTAAGLTAIPLLLYGYPRFHVPVAPFFAMFAATAVAARPWTRADRGRRDPSLYDL